MKRADKIYSSPEWRHFRAEILARDGYRCTKCGRDISGPGWARCDHIIPVKAGGAFWDPSNARSLCPTCDNQSHAEKGSGAPYRQERFELAGCDISGMPYSRKIPQNA
jgi:5-methylcytosine-specific restriction endonuclease McrA